MSVARLREMIEKRLAEYIPDPTVTVMLLKAASLRAYVIGKVNNPGQFPINGETNVMQVLAMAGGLNPYAAAKKIIVLRQQGAETIEFPFNYHEVEKGENLKQNILLERGDVVVVP
jgi:polysaccharide export outer membrane protein